MVSGKNKEKELVKIEKREVLSCPPKINNIEIIQDLSLPIQSFIDVQYKEEPKPKLEGIDVQLKDGVFKFQVLQERMERLELVSVTLEDCKTCNCYEIT